MTAAKDTLGELHEALAQLMLNELRWYMSWLPIKLLGLYDHH